MTTTVDESDDASDTVSDSASLCWNFGPGEFPPLAAIRRQLTTWLAGVTEDVIADLQLIVTELVTNAYEHGWLPGQVRATRSAATVIRVEVDDRAPTLPRRRPAPGSPTTGADVRGRGLALVEALATRWGVTRARWGKTVWAELDAQPAPR